MTSPYQTPIRLVLDDMQARIEARRKNLPVASDVKGSGVVPEEPECHGQTNLSGPEKAPNQRPSGEGITPAGPVTVIGDITPEPASPPAQDQFTPAESGQTLAAIVPRPVSTSLAVAKQAEDSEGPERDGNKPLMRNRQPDEASPTGYTASDTFTPAEFRARIKRQAMGLERV